MDYGTFRQPSPGYSAPAKQPVVLPAAASEPLAYADGKEGQFFELRVTGGVGPFHVNHFVVYSGLLELSNPQPIVAPLLQSFYSSFISLFEPDNAAKADQGEYTYKGADTIEFELGGVGDWDVLPNLGGLLHSDWVSFQKSDDGESFYASTLRRGWLLFSEKLALAATTGATRRALAEEIKVNQHHFLAGRRSFRFGYDPALRRLYVETAALERSSICEYRLLEKTGALRSTIIELWTTLLVNVQKRFHIPFVAPSSLPPAARAGYQITGNVAYRTAEFASATEALTQPWFAKLLPRHPGLLKNVVV
jgi:hypothetical protein